MGSAATVLRYPGGMRHAVETFGGLDILAHHPRSLPSRVEIRPSRPPKKG